MGPSLVIALALIAILFGGTGTSGGQGVATATVEQLTVTQSVIIRVPARRSHRANRRAHVDPPAMPVFRDRKGPRCIDAGAIAGAAIAAPDSVDFILRGGQRVRARLEDECPALDYYSGFYVKPAGDGKICANRDSIRTRSGGDCQVDRFRLLIPVPQHSPPSP
ncbi:hypothetical protein [Sphingomonas sp. PR090111-T3T-6A]|uniref:hypothetical protein n=1 Tax=Sphingomonas sp. PR090111-T3T-6A TaxID=685778 RepID=UPI000360FE4C|nr:hypothetical protein [Sphingomonas sp. PR090111-T3T-6A]